MLFNSSTPDFLLAGNFKAGTFEVQPPKIRLKADFFIPQEEHTVTGCGRFFSSFRALELCRRLFSLTFLSTAFGHPADGCSLDFEFSPGPSVITVGSQRDLFQGLSIHWVIFCSRKSFSDRSSTPAFLPTIARWILPVKAIVKLSMSKRRTKYFAFALGVLRLSVLCLFSSA